MNQSTRGYKGKLFGYNGTKKSRKSNWLWYWQRKLTPEEKQKLRENKADVLVAK